MLEKKMKERIDKPTIYKAVNYLTEEGWITVHHKERSGMVKYYQPTPSGLTELLTGGSGWLGLYPKGTLPERPILAILSKNPELTPGDEWIQTVRSLSPHFEAASKKPFNPPWFDRGLPRLYYKWRDGDVVRLTLQALITDKLLSAGSTEQAVDGLRALFKTLMEHPRYMEEALSLLKKYLQQELEARGEMEQGIAALQMMLNELEPRSMPRS